MIMANTSQSLPDTTSCQKHLQLEIIPFSVLTVDADADNIVGCKSTRMVALVLLCFDEAER